MNTLRPLASATSVLALGGCNPLVYGKILDDAPVKEFSLEGPTGSVAHGGTVVTWPALDDGIGHALLAGTRGLSLAYLSINDAGGPVSVVIDQDQATALAGAVPSIANATTGAVVAVPAPVATDRAEHALVAILSIDRAEQSRIVRFNASNFTRTDDTSLDIVIPRANRSLVTSFGKTLAAGDLDGTGDPRWEVAIGSDQGVLIYDDLGLDVPTYAAARAMILLEDPDAFDGSADRESWFFTLCEDFGSPANGLAAGPVLPDGSTGFLVATATGLFVIGPPVDAAAVNRVGTPLFDCAADTRALPAGASDGFGTALLFADHDGDGMPTLFVGDPGANAVHVWPVGPSGLADAPSQTLVAEGAVESGDRFGHSVSFAQVGGEVGTVLVIGAPGTNVRNHPLAGAVHVLRAPAFEPVVVLEDETPHDDTQHGLWAGGVARNGHDELVVTGEDQGRIHAQIVPGDPAPDE